MGQRGLSFELVWNKYRITMPKCDHNLATRGQTLWKHLIEDTEKKEDRMVDSNHHIQLPTEGSL